MSSAGKDSSRDVLQQAFLKIFELESLTLVASNRWREQDGTFRNHDMHDEYFYELINNNRRGLEKLLADADRLVRIYPAFVLLPLLRAFGALTLRVVKGAPALEGARLRLFDVLKRLEQHTATDEHAEDGWAVIRSIWTILLSHQRDLDFDDVRRDGLGDLTPPDLY